MSHYSHTPLSHVVFGLTLAVLISGASTESSTAPAPHHFGTDHPSAVRWMDVRNRAAIPHRGGSEQSAPPAAITIAGK
jgi:hypothetical protein